MRKYFYTDGVDRYGPITKNEMRDLDISRSTKIWHYGLADWTDLDQIPELQDIVASIPPILASNQAQSELHDKSYSSDKNSNSPNLKKHFWTNTWSWIIILGSIILILIVVTLVKRKVPDVKLYNEVVANSYQPNESFDIYIDKFFRDLEYFGIFPQKPKTSIIKFSRLDQMELTTHIHGLSYGLDDNDIIEIYINPSTWKKFNKPMRYLLMYHELAHDVLNLDDLDAIPANEGKLMYPNMASYERMSMDEFIESTHALFEEISLQN